MADLLLLEEGHLGIIQIQEDDRHFGEPAGVEVHPRLGGRFGEGFGGDLRNPHHVPIPIGFQGGVLIRVIAEVELVDERPAAVVLLKGGQRHPGDPSVLHDHGLEFVRSATHREQVEGVVDQRIGGDIRQNVGGQHPEGQIIQEGGERLRQTELQGVLIQGFDLNIRPQVLQIIRDGERRIAQQAHGEDHILGGDWLPVVPDRIRLDGKIVNRAVPRNPPGFCQIGLRHAGIVKTQQAAENQAVHVAVCRVVEIEQGVETRKFAEQRFGVRAAGDRLRGFGRGLSDRLLAEEQHPYRDQRQNDNRNLPAKGFHGVSDGHYLRCIKKARETPGCPASKRGQKRPAAPK